MKVLVTKRAQNKYHSIKEYIQNKWGEYPASAFEQKTKDFFNLLRNYPKIGTLEYPEKKILGFQLSKQTKVFYRIKGKQIIILTFFDVRQHPNKKTKQIL